MAKIVIIKGFFFFNKNLWQIEAVKYKGSECVGIYKTLIHPDNMENIPNMSIALKEGLESAPSLEEVTKTLKVFAEDCKVEYI